MAAICRIGNLTLKETLECLEEKYGLSEVLDRLHNIAIDKKCRSEDPNQKKQIDDLVNLLEQAVDLALVIEVGTTRIE